MPYLEPNEIHDLAMDLREQALESTSIDILGLYCLHTGRLMGRFDWEELEFTIQQLPEMDAESTIDDLLVRVIASMRPSIAWNKPDRFTISDMVNLRPADCMAYLVNRLTGHRQILSSRGDHSFQPLLDRIWNHRRFTQLADDGFDFKPWIHWMLELDAKMNLNDMYAPRVVMIVNRAGKPAWMLSHNEGDPLTSLITIEDSPALLQLFESWAWQKLRDFDKRDAMLLKESQWVRGNTMAKTAFVESWKANPVIANKRLQAEYDAKQKAKAKAEKSLVTPLKKRPPSKTDAMLAMFQSQLSAIMDSSYEDAQATAATPPKSTGKIILGGLKLIRKPLESVA